MTQVQSGDSNSICRLCSCVFVSGVKSIFGNPEPSGVKVADIIWECLQIKVADGDGLPECVCQACWDTTQRFTEFRQKCHRTQLQLAEGKHTDADTDALEKAEADVDNDNENDNGETDNEDNDSGGGESGEGELGEPAPDDYVLMKEETFTMDPAKANSTTSANRRVVEWNNNQGERDRDRDLVEWQRARHELLPPMWDVYERHPPPPPSTDPDTNSGGAGAGVVRVTHRRYVVSKGGFPCSLCGACFRFDQGCHRGRGAASPLYDCILCHKVFGKRSAWKRHQQSVHQEEEALPFVCRHCGLGFDRQHLLARHLRQAHPTTPQSADSVSRPFACPRCQQSFVRREHLVRHCERAHSPQPKPFACDHPSCGKTFTRREHLRRHKVTHAKDEKSVKTEGEEECSPPSPSPSPSPPSSAAVKCDVCGKSFSRRSHVLRHMKRIHNTDVASATPETYGCDVCHKQFGRKYHLERHRLSHPAAPAAPVEYECVTCGDKFGRTQALDEHMTAVHGNAAIHTFLWM